MKKLSLGTILVLCWILRIIGFAVLIGGFAFLEYNLTIVTIMMGVVGVAILFASCYIEGAHYVCPHCRTWIGVRNLPYGYCRHCGQKLTVEPEDTEE